MLKSYIEENKNDIVFFRNGYRRFIYVAIFLLVVNYIIVIFMFNRLITVQIPPNFATTSDGRLVTLHGQT